MVVRDGTKTETRQQTQTVGRLNMKSQLTKKVNGGERN